MVSSQSTKVNTTSSGDLPRKPKNSALCRSFQSRRSYLLATCASRPQCIYLLQILFALWQGHLWRQSGLCGSMGQLGGLSPQGSVVVGLECCARCVTTDHAFLSDRYLRWTHLHFCPVLGPHTATKVPHTGGRERSEWSPPAAAPTTEMAGSSEQHTPQHKFGMYGWLLLSSLVCSCS